MSAVVPSKDTRDSNSISYEMFRTILMAMHEAAVVGGKWSLAPVILRGKHGIGKTECVREIASLMGLPAVEIRAAQLTDGDLLGVPFKVKGPDFENGTSFGDVTKFAPPEKIALACVQPVILFMDELDRASTKSVEQGLFQLADSRRIGDAILHPRTIIIAAINGGIHKAALSGRYKVSPMDAASLSRWISFDFTPSVSDWMAWATREDAGEGIPNVLQVVTDFIESNPTLLDEPERDIQPGVKTQDRRAWRRLSDAMRLAGWTDSDAFETPGVFPAFNALCAAHLGTDVGYAFARYAQTYNNRITIEDIEKGRASKAKIDKISQADKATLAAGLFAKYHCKPIPPKVLDNMCLFLLAIEPEIGSRAFSGQLPGFPYTWNDVRNIPVTPEEKKQQEENIRNTVAHPKHPILALQRAAATRR